MSCPTCGDARNLHHFAKWLSNKNWHGVESKVDRKNGSETVLLECFVDADHGHGDRSTTGYQINANGYTVLCSSTTQPGLPSLSSGESELRAMTRAICDLLFVDQILESWGSCSRLVVYGDASAALAAASKMTGSRLKHLRSCDTFVRAVARRGLVELVKIGTAQNVADIYTKYVDPSVYQTLTPQTGFRALTDEEKSAKSVGLVKMNEIHMLKSSDKIMEAHEKRAKQATRDTGVALGRMQLEMERFTAAWKDVNRPENACGTMG
jgi:hypothetical protein